MVLLMVLNLFGLVRCSDTHFSAAGFAFWFVEAWGSLVNGKANKM